MHNSNNTGRIVSVLTAIEGTITLRKSGITEVKR